MRKLILGLVFIGLIAVGLLMSGVFSSRTAESSYRHNLMETVKYTAGSISGIVSGKLPAHDGHLIHQAKILHHTAAMGKAAFQKDTRSEGGKTDSKDAIWENWSDFAAKMDKFETDTAAFVTAAESGDEARIKASLKTVFSDCGSCHTPYRK